MLKWIPIALGAAFVGILLLATQIRDLYEIFTGETWEERVKRLNTKNNEQRQKKQTEQGK